MKKILSAFLACCAPILLAVCAQASDKDHTVTIPVYEWEPYSGQALRGYGLATEIAADALTRNGYKVAYAFVPWKRALEVARRGEYEVLPGMWYSDERNESFDFSNRVLANELVTVTVNFDGGSSNHLAAEDLRNRRVALVRGYHYPDSLLQQPGVIFEEGVSLGANLKKLFYRRVDVVVGDRVASGWLGRRLFGEASDLLQVTGEPLVTRNLYIGISRRSPRRDALRTHINDELQRLRDAGQLASRIRAYIDAARPELSDAMKTMLAVDKPPE